MRKLKQLSFILAFLISAMQLRAQTCDPIGNGIGQDVSQRNDVEVHAMSFMFLKYGMELLGVTTFE